MNKIFGIFFALLIGLILSIIGYGIFIAVDSWFMPYSVSSGMVMGRNHTPGYIQTTYISNGNGGATPVMTWIPDTYQLKIQIEKGSDWVSVNEYSYFSNNIGSILTVDFQQGRISDDVYIKLK